MFCSTLWNNLIQSRYYWLISQMRKLRQRWKLSNLLSFMPISQDLNSIVHLLSLLPFFFFFAALGLCCSTWDFSLVALHRLSCPVACGILVPHPGIDTPIPCIGKQILNHWASREVPTSLLRRGWTPKANLRKKYMAWESPGGLSKEQGRLQSNSLWDWISLRGRHWIKWLHLPDL